MFSVLGLDLGVRRLELGVERVGLRWFPDHAGILENPG